MSTIKNEIPKVGLTKMLLNYSQINENLVSFFKETLDKNDGLVQVRIPYKLVLTDRPELIRHFLQKNNKNYIKTSVIRKTVKKEIGEGLFTSDGKYWLKQRRSIQPGFHRQRLERISKIMVEQINEYMDTVLDKYVDTNQEIDLADEMAKLAFKVITKSLFGKAFEDDKLEIIGDMISSSQQYVMNQTRKPYLKPWYHINGDHAENERLKKIRDKIIISFIEERKRSGEKVDDLLDMLLETEYEDGSRMTNKQLLDESIVLLVAGHETSAVTMTWAWYLLGSHPEIEQKVLDSVNEALGDKDPSFEQLRKLGYPLQVLEETMRLYPVVWIIDREPLEDDEYDGIQIKKGEDIAGFIFGLHRNPKYWKTPNEFDPNRFSPENKKHHVPFSYLPFGGGPRLCIGKNFAQMEMQFILSMLIRRYKFVLSPNQKVDFKPLLTLCPSNGIKVRVQKRTLTKASKEDVAYSV